MKQDIAVPAGVQGRRIADVVEPLDDLMVDVEFEITGVLLLADALHDEATAAQGRAREMRVKLDQLRATVAPSDE